MKKACKDQQCSRAGILLALSEFPRNKASRDQRYLYCKECCRRKTRAQRGVTEVKTYRPRQADVRRKPVVRARLVRPKRGVVLSLVYEALRSGCRTRQAIHKHTQLDYDAIGEALCELIWEAGAVRIVNREFVLIEDIYLAA